MVYDWETSYDILILHIARWWNRRQEELWFVNCIFGIPYNQTAQGGNSHCVILKVLLLSKNRMNFRNLSLSALTIVSGFSNGTMKMSQKPSAGLGLRKLQVTLSRLNFQINPCSH